MLVYMTNYKDFKVMNKKRIIFLDRDGVINKDHGYVSKIEEFEFIDGVFDACKYFNSLGYEIIVVTNQSGIGRGYYTQNDFEKLTTYMLQKFEENGVKVLKVYFCPHSPEVDCSCRKPNTGMIEEACKDFEIDLNQSWLIGDKISDIETAINANIKNHILITKEKDKTSKASSIANSLLDTINIIRN